jgi:hypothetical protein
VIGGQGAAVSGRRPLGAAVTKAPQNARGFAAKLHANVSWDYREFT